MFHHILRRRRDSLAFALFALFQCSVFWLGRLSVQLASLESELAAGKRIAQNQEANMKSNKLSTYLVVLIMSRPEESELRSAIRQTWLRLSTKTPQMYRHLFPVGVKNLSASALDALNAESDRNGGDLLLLRDLTEAYDALTKKTLLSISVSVKSMDFYFLLKVDGDSFVRLGALLKSLRDIEHPHLYWGFLDGRARPFQGGKWREDEWKLCDRYLPYQLGGGYVLSRALAEHIQRNQAALKLYRNEDVSVGVWLAGTRVKYVHDPRFDTEWKSRGCNNEYLITHKKSPAEMRQLFESLAKLGVLCHSGEFQLRPSYIYDFSRPPSECCTRRNGTRIP